MANNSFLKGLSVKEILILLAVLIFGTVFILLVRYDERSREQEKALQVACSIEISLPRTALNSLPENPEELKTLNFNELKNTLRQIIAINDKARFAYLYVERNNKLYFLVDSEPESSPDYSPPGQEFTEADQLDRIPFRSGQAQITKPVTDRWGTWVSVEVPVKDESGKTIAVFGMDYDAQSWKHRILNETTESFLLVLFILFLIVAYMRNIRKSKALQKEASRREIAEQQIRERESDYRLLFELNPQPMLVYDLESMKILAVNQAALDKYGYSEAEFLEMAITDLKTSDEFLHTRKNLVDNYDFLQHREIWNHQLKNGRIIQVEVHSHNFDFRHKNARLVLLIDITESLMTEKALSENQLQLTNLVGNLPGFVYRCALDENYTMDFISEGCARITGYVPEEFVAAKTIAFNDLILSEYQDSIRQKWMVAIREKSYFEDVYPILTASGEQKWLWERGRGVFDSKGELHHLEGYIEDVTDQKLAEKQLKKLSRAVEQNPVSIVITDAEGTIEYVNPRFTEVTGYEATEAIGKNPRILKSGKMDKKFYRELWATIKSGGVWNGEIINKRKSGELYWANKSISPILDSQGQISNYVAIGEEITEKKRNEAELIKAKEKAEESDRLKSAFLANISHEIRTPMNGILGFADLLKSPDLSPENQQEFIEVIEQSGQRMLNVINDLIDISKIEAGEMNLKIYDTNLNLLVEELYKLFKPKADEKKLEFSYSAGISDEESIVMTDGGKLYQILANLIKNAIKFTNLGHIEFGYSQSDYQLNFFVKDTGIGIPEEQREIIFERFRQGSNSLNRKYEGAGLGLTISKAYVELLGGQMWVESELYQGTTFGFSIPRHSGNQSSEINPHEDNLSEKNMDITVLIAEDDESNRLFIRKALENNVSTLLFACTGAEAVEMVETHEKIDVVLMDLKLPVMDGFEATRQIKRLRPDLSVIAQTTFINTEDKEKALAAGCSDFMTKPIKRKALLDAILKSLTLWLIILLVSCTPWTAPVQPDPAKPMVVEAHGYVVPVDSIQKPLIIPAGKPTQVRIGKLPEFPAYSNVILAGTLKRIQAGQPYIWTPGENNLNIPKVVKATEKPFFSHPPEVVLAKDAYSKDINPQNFSNYNKLQGLKHDQIRNLIQDRLGNIWFSTDDGVTKFDGKYFSHYSTDQGLNNSLILSVLQDSKNNLWFGTFGGGVTRYDGRYFTNFTTEEGLPNNIVNSIYEDRSGNIWFGTGGGATRYDGQNFTQYSTATGLCSNDVRAIIEDLKGNFWIATNGGGISKFDGKSFYNYNTDQGLPINYISTLFLDQAGNLWIGTSNRGALKFDGCYFTYFTEKEGLCSNYVKTIIQDDDGSIWIGTSENGISRYDGKYFTQFTEKEGLGINIVRSSLKDRNGNLWFGTRGAGVSKFQGKIFTHLTEHEGLSNSRIMSILEDKSGNFWFGSFGGYVTKLSTREVNGEKQNYYTYLGEKEGLLFNRIYSIIQDNDGNIWFGTDGGGVSKFDGKIMTTYTMKEGLCDGSIRKIMQDRDGNFWFCSYGGGVSKFDGKTFTNYSMKEGLSAKNILCVFQDKKGNIWFGTDGGGVTRFDGQQFTHYSKKEGMSSNTVYSIMDDNDGNLWFGTAGEGVSKFDGKYFTNFSEKQGLSNNYVLSILKDKKGNLWFGTRFGPNVLKAGSLEREQKQEVSLFKTYGYEDGFLGLGCNLGAIAEDHFGKIWIGTNDRLSTFHPEGEISDTIPPNIQLTNIQLFNEKIPWSDLFSKQDSVIELKNGVNVSNFRFKSISQWYAIPEQLSLSHTDNYLTFDFIGITQTQAKKVRYQYKLEGVDKTWSSLTDRTEASYGNLNNGKYTFRVKAVNSEGYWSNEINYTFTIRPPWWKTWWFYLVLSSAIVSLIYSYIRFREQKLQNDKIKLQKKVDEQTRELTEKNNVLITQKNEILLKNQDIEKKNNELQIINSEKDKFFSVIAHDVRGPLSSFLSLTEILTEDLHKMTKDDLEQIANSMHTSAQNLYELLSNLLDWSRMQRGIISSSPKIVNLNELALNCSALIIDAAKNKPVELTLNIPEGTVIFADANMIAAVIRNLLTNAVKFTPPGGKAALTAHITGENEIEIAVSDTGIGIPENMIQQLFKLSSGGASRIGTAGEPSTGLGLLICKEFIEMHDGQIRVESEVGKGSTFRFNLKIHA